MSIQCKVNNKLTPPEVRSTTPEEKDMEAVEDTEVMEDTEAEEEVKEDLDEVEGQSSAITVDSKVTSHETTRRLPATTVKPSIMLLRSAKCFLPRFKRSSKTKMSNSLESKTSRQVQL